MSTKYLGYAQLSGFDDTNKQPYLLQTPFHLYLFIYIIYLDDFTIEIKIIIFNFE